MATSERAAAGDVVAQAHAKLLADTSLQFHFTPFQIPKPPNWPWLAELLKALIGLGPVLRILFWLAVAALALAVVVAIARAVLHYRKRYAATRIGRLNLGPEPANLQPAARRAAALLEEADHLAAQQRFEEAAHVLLFRTIADLEARRPRTVRPALTSRDIAALDEIPATARGAFAAIAELVERSFFGGRTVGASEFAACRGAYLRFASPDSWAAGARS